MTLEPQALADALVQCGIATQEQGDKLAEILSESAAETWGPMVVGEPETSD